MNDPIEMQLSTEECAIIETVRKYMAVAPSYVDFRIEIRQGKLARILPTFSEVLPGDNKGYATSRL